MREIKSVQYLVYPFFRNTIYYLKHGHKILQLFNIFMMFIHVHKNIYPRKLNNLTSRLNFKMLTDERYAYVK